MPTIDDTASLKYVVQPLLDVAKLEADVAQERRAADRHPFLRPVTIAVEDGSEETISAFTRDISPLGVGLLHNRPLAPNCRVKVTVPRQSGDDAHLWAEIVWCRSFTEGWHVSGARFVDAGSAD